MSPTDKQRENLKLRGGSKYPSGKSSLSRFARRELSAETQGYNIPGVPSVGISYVFKKDGTVVIRVSPLLSKKGVGEQVTGNPLSREEAK